MPTSLRSALFVQIAGIGDFVLALPLFAAFRRTYPTCSMKLLTNGRVLDLAHACKFFDAVYLAPTPDTFDSLGGTLSGLWQYLKLAYQLRRTGVERFVSLKPISSPRGRLLIWFLWMLVNASWSVGRNTEGRGDFFDGCIDEMEIEFRHELEFYRLIGQMLDVEVDDELPRLEVDPATDRWADEFLEQQGRRRGTLLIGLHPGAFRPTRRWPVERFVEVALRLKKEFDCDFLLTGGRVDLQFAKYFLDAQVDDLLTACGNTTLMQLIALLSRVDLFITNDTGPMHIAAALQRPMVAIFGPGEVNRFSPVLALDRLRVIRHDVDCAPCYLDTCSHHSCMVNLPVEQVFAAARELLCPSVVR